jgi:threonine dehydrogenase-like Zn-dependent dehydrogenase
MKASLLSSKGFAVVDREPPHCGRHDVLIRTAACGVCEGDVFVYRMNREGTAAVPVPGSVEATDLRGTLLGHEGSGIVEKVGEEVGGFKPGEYVTAIGGPYAEFFTATPDKLVKLPASVDPVFALGEPLACGVHAANRFGIRLGDRVVIIGMGFMGVLCLALARMQGPSFIAVSDPLAWRLETARRFGADETLAPQELEKRYASDDPRHEGSFDVVIEATGVAAAVETATLLVKQHGRIVFVGYHQSENGRRNVDMQCWNYKAIDIVNGHVRRNDEKRAAMEAAVALVAAGKLDLRSLVGVYKLGDTEKAFADLVRRKRDLFKAVLVP